MKKTTIIATLIGGILLSGSAMAAGGAKAIMKVQGTILPPSCSIGVDGALTFNDIDPAKLSKDAFTDLPMKKTKVSVLCLGSSFFGIRATDNSVVAAEKPGVLNENLFSLGQRADGKQIGVYTINVNTDESSVEGKEAQRAFYMDKDGMWIDVLNKEQSFMKNSKIVPVSGMELSSDNSRKAVKNKVYALDIQASIAPVGADGVQRSINLDGSATFEVIYM